MAKLITATSMARSFSDIISRVHYQGEIFDIQKGANIVARISPAKFRPSLKACDLKDFFANAPKLDKEDIEDFRKDIEDIRKLDLMRRVSKWD